MTKKSVEVVVLSDSEEEVDQRASHSASRFGFWGFVQARDIY